MFVSIFNFECLNISTHFRHFKFCFVFSQIKVSIKNHAYLLSYSHSLKCPRHRFCFSSFLFTDSKICAFLLLSEKNSSVFLYSFLYLKSLHCKRIFQSLCIAKEFWNFHCIFEKIKLFFFFELQYFDYAYIELVVDGADDTNINNLMPEELPQKLNFQNLDKVLDDNNYVGRPKENVHPSMQTPKII